MPVRSRIVISPGTCITVCAVASERPGLRHRLPRICATLSPDAKLLASGGTSGATYVWDAASGNLRHRLLQNPGTVYASHFSADLKNVTTVEFQNVDKKTQLNRWDVASGELLSSKELDVPIRGATLHPDGNWLATFYYEIDPKQKDSNQRYYKGELILWNLQTGDRKVLIRDNPSGILCAHTFSPDAKYLAAGTSYQGPRRLWPLPTETGADYATFRGSNRGWVHDITFTRDSKFLLYRCAPPRGSITGTSPRKKSCPRSPAATPWTYKAWRYPPISVTFLSSRHRPLHLPA